MLSREGKGNERVGRQGGVSSRLRVHLFGLEAVTVHVDGLGFRDGDRHVAWHQPEMPVG